MSGATLQGRPSTHGYTDARGYGLKPTSPCAHSSFHALGVNGGLLFAPIPSRGHNGHRDAHGFMNSLVAARKPT